jgi:hypothetical protein
MQDTKQEKGINADIIPNTGTQGFGSFWFLTRSSLCQSVLASWLYGEDVCGALSVSELGVDG